MMHLHVCISFVHAALSSLLSHAHVTLGNDAVLFVATAYESAEVTVSPQTDAPGRRHGLGPDVEVVSLQWSCIQPCV